MYEAFVTSPYFGITLSLGAYIIGWFINKKSGLSVLNPLLIALIICIAFVALSGVGYDNYNIGGKYISVLLIPATICLALPIYRKRAVLKKNALPIIIGCAVGAAVSMICIFLLCKAFGLNDTLTASLLPKSITTPFGMEVSESLGGIPSVTIICIVITGVLGAATAPLLIKLFKIDSDVAQGIAIGTCSHALGTTKALQIGETQGAMSGLAITIAGLFTVVYSMFL